MKTKKLRKKIIKTLRQHAFAAVLAAVLVFFSISSFLILSIVEAADTNDDILVYRGGGDTSIPEYKTHNTSGFSAESTAIDVTGPIKNIKVVAKPDASSDEKVMCTVDNGSDVNCQVYDGTSWGDLNEHTAAAGSNNRVFDLAYEHTSGDTMVCYRDSSDTSIPNCDIWNGTDWSTSADAADVTGAINTIKLIPDPNSDYIALLIRDGTADVNVQIWNGSTWGSLQEVETGAGGCTACTPYDGAWETSSDDFVAIWFDDASDELQSREFDKIGGWGSETTGVITGLSIADSVYVLADNNPDAVDEITVLVADDDNTLTANEWSGASWGVQEELSANIGTISTSNHPFYLAYEHANDYDAIASYGVTNNDLNYKIWDSSGSSWGSEQSLPNGVEDRDWHQLAFDPSSDIIMLTTVGTVNDVDTIEWDGSSFDGSWTSHETSSNDVKWNAWFAFDFEVEDITPPEISTWDLNMNTGKLIVNFNETMDTALTPTFTTFTVQDAATAGTSHTLTGGSHSWTDGDTVEITLSASDLNSIKIDQSLATSSSDSYLRIAASSNLKDVDGNELAAIVDGSAIQVTSYTADSTSPTFITWDLDMNAATATLNFSEAVDASTLDVTAITIQDAATAGTSYTLTNSSTASGDGTAIVITLSSTDLNALKTNTSLVTSIADSFIRFTTSAIDDMAGNGITAISDGSAVQASSYTADSTSPSLVSWTLNMNLGEITLSFNEAVDVSTLTVAAITIQDAAPAGTSHTLTTSTSASSDGVSIVITLSGADLTAIQADAGLATSITNSYIRFTSSAIDDMAGNAVTAIVDASAVQASTYTAGTSFEQSAYRLFNNLDSTDVGAALAAQDTSATLTSPADAFRLRQLIHISFSDLAISAQDFKLQFATQSGTCDTLFTGETYADVTAATDIAYNNNATPADSASLTPNGSDPTHAADTIVNQSYEELNNFSNSIAAISVGRDGKWDFSLIDNGAPGNTSYCFRIVKSTAALLDTYTVIPEIKTAAVANIAPTATTPASISQATDGSGKLTFSTTITDTDLDETRLQVEYSDDGGATFYDAELISASPDVGSLDLDNSSTYQIGSTNRIDTDTSAVVITIVWDTQSVSNGNGAVTGEQSDIQLRVKPNDFTIDGSNATTGNFTVDNAAANVITTSVSPSSGSIVPGNIATVTIASDETGLVVGPSGCEVNNVDVAATLTDLLNNSYTLSYQVGSSHNNWSAGNLSISCELVDAFGNAVTAASFTDGNTFSSNIASSVSGSSGGGGGVIYSQLLASKKATSKPVVVPEKEIKLNHCGRNNKTLIPFLDTQNHWGRLFIEALYRSCTIEGRTALRFEPNNTLSRAEAAKIVILSFGFETAAHQTIFDDVPSNAWFSGYVIEAVNRGIIIGRQIDGQRLFQPNAPINRAEAIVTILNAQSIDLGTHQSKFVDINPNDWFYQHIAYAESQNILTGFPIGENQYAFRPDAPITRAEFIKLMYFSVFAEISNQLQNLNFFPLNLTNT